MGRTLVEMAVDIVQAQCSTTNMTTEEITAALQGTFRALQTLQQNEACGVLEAVPGAGEAAAPEAAASPVAPEKSILRNKIICLECGQEFKMLSPKHLSSHGLDGKQYRSKYGFPKRQPLCAKALSERRKKAGKERGLPAKLRENIAKRKTDRAAAAKTKK